MKNLTIANKLELTDYIEEVTLLFADIAGFTKYSANVKPQEVLIMLSELFSEFDKHCIKNKVYKLYTIGDCYVIMGVLNSNERSPIQEAINIVNMGLDMMEIIRQVRRKINFPELDMRIGIHTVKFLIFFNRDSYYK